MSNVTKLIAALTALLVAVGTLVGTISMTIGRGRTLQPASQSSSMVPRHTRTSAAVIRRLGDSYKITTGLARVIYSRLLRVHGFPPPSWGGALPVSG